jgi:purine nucleosidase
VAVDLDHKRFWDLVTDALVRIGEPALAAATAAK